MDRLMYVIYADVVFDPFAIAVYEIRQNLPLILLIAAVIIVTVITIKKNKKK
ncbi:MAG: hypothetical protein K2K57_13570 [Oscillospiraceae bacterium]|nr:hypothetical protein [Oscillospiraceae bacterium]